MATELRNIPANTIVDGVKYIGEFDDIYALYEYLKDPETGGKIVTDPNNKILTYDITDSTASDIGPSSGIILNSIFTDNDNQEIWSNSSIFLPNGSLQNQRFQFKKTENGLVHIGFGGDYFSVYALSIGSRSGEPGPDAGCTTIDRGHTQEVALRIETTKNSSQGETISLPYPSSIDESKTRASIVLDVKLDKTMSKHNSDKTAHQDIRDLIAQGGSGVTIDTSIPETPLDTNVPSTKLLSTELDKKFNNPVINNPIHIGDRIYDPSLEQRTNILIGHNTSAHGTGHGIVVGYGSSSWESSIVIGEGSCVASGEDNNPNGNSSIIIGNGSDTSEAGCILIGNGSTSVSKNGIVIGNDAGHGSSGENLIIISNYESGATAGDNSIVIGGKLAHKQSICIGNLAGADDQSVVVGHNASGEDRSTSVGYGALSKDESVAIGANSSANPNSIAIGYNSEANSTDIVIGSWASTASATGEPGGIVIGHHASGEERSVVIGKWAIGKEGSVTIGSSCQTKSRYAIAIGSEAAASGEKSIAIGLGAAASGEKSIAIGCYATGEGGIAIGLGAYAKSGEIAIGNNAVIDNVDYTAGGRPEILLKSKNIDLAINENYMEIIRNAGNIAINLDCIRWLHNYSYMGQPAKLETEETKITIASSGEFLTITYPGTGETDPNFLSLSIGPAGSQYVHMFELVTKDSIDTTTIPETPIDTQVPSTKLMATELAKKLNALSVQDLSSLKVSYSGDLNASLVKAMTNFNKLIDLLTAASQS